MQRVNPIDCHERAETMTPSHANEVGTGFRVSDKPVVESRRTPRQPMSEPAGGSVGLPDAFSDHALYVIARDPKSLFVYWDLDLSRRFADAGLSQRQVQLRVLREDGSEEAAAEIDPMVGYSFVDVSTPGTRYACELGCVDGSEWKTLVRSGSTETPEAAMSDDLAADFATLPFHLSFQRLIDIFRASPKDEKTLSESVARMQTKARTLQASLPAGDWLKLVGAATASLNAEAGFGLSGVPSSDLATLLRTVKCDSSQRVPSPENLVRLRHLGESFGGSSWGGAS